MNLLLRWYPGDAAVEFAGRLIFEISLVIGAAALLAFVAMRRRPAARHALWLGVLLSVALAPLTLAAVERAGWIWTVPRPGSLDDKPPIDAPPAAPKIADLTRDSAPQPADRTRAADSWESTDGNRSAVNSETRTRIVAVSSRPADVWRALASAATFVWLAGMTFLLARLFRGHRQVRQLLSDVQPIDSGRIEKSLGIAAATLGVQRLPPIVTSSAVAGPVVAGLVRPTVVLPADFVMRAGISQLADVLVHECSHALQWDLWVGLVQRLVQLAFWPHPLVYFMNRSLSRAREEVCDNYVLRRGDAVGYARTLLELAGQYDARPAPGATLAIFSPRWKLEDRVAGLLDPQRHRTTRVGPAKFLALVALLVAGGSALAAGRFDDPEPKETAAAHDAPAAADEEPGTTVAAADDKVIAAIENLGGTVEIDEKSPGKPIIGIELSSQKVTDDDLKVVEGLSSLRRLNLNWTQIGDAGLEHIKGITTLESLYLERCANVTDAGLAHLKGLTNLTDLTLAHTSATNAGIGNLKNLTKLQLLDLTGVPVTDEGAKHLHGLKDLKLLSFYRVGDIDLRPPLVTVAAVRELQTLLPDCQIIHKPPGDRKAAEAEMRRRFEEATREEEARKEQVTRLIKNGFTVRNIQEAVAAIQQLPVPASVGKLAEGASEVDLAKEGPRKKPSIVGVKEYQPGDKVVSVGLPNLQINDEFVAHLRFLADLEILTLQKTPISDAAPAHLEPLENLKFLDVGGTNVTDAGLAHLKGLTKIEKLRLWDTKVTDAGLMHLKGMENLKDLALNNTHVTDAGLEQLQAFKNLETLQLDGTKVTDAGLVHLLGLTKLKWLGLRRTKVTDSGVADLQKALPDLKIRRRGP